MKALLSLILLALCLAIPAGPAQAHALDPGFLSVEPVEGDLYRVTFRRPDVSGRPMPIDAVLPKHCEPRTGPEPVRSSDTTREHHRPRRGRGSWPRRAETGLAA